jgi:hypothetical protein
MTRRRHRRQDAIQLARRAEREMRRWRVILTASERAEICEPTRRERVSSEINRERKERARRSVSMTVAASAGASATMGPTQSAMPVRKAGGRVAAEISTVASSRRLTGRERLRPSAVRP